MSRLSLALLISPILFAAPHTGVVRTGSQPVPGAAVTAVLGERKVVSSTDENGRYSLELDPGQWTVSVEMFGFQPDRKTLTQAEAPTSADWTLQFIAAAPPRPKPVAGPKPGAFQTARLNQNTEALAQMERETTTASEPAAEGGDTQAFLVSGSVSQGLQRPGQEDLGFLMRMFDNPGGPGGGPGMEGAPGGGPGGGPGGAGGFGGPGGGGGGFGGPGGGGGFGGGRGGFGGPGGGRGFGGPGGPGGPGGGRFQEYMARLSPEEREAMRKRMEAARGSGAGRAFGNRRGRGQQGIRGMFSYTFGNSAFDARPYSITGQDFGKPSYSQNRISAMLGGPLKIPKLINSPRTLFTLQFSGNLNRSPYNGYTTVPTELERAGNFSQSLSRGPLTIFDPLSGAPFPNNQIPASRIDPAATGLLRFIPLPNQTGSIQNYHYVTSVDRMTDQANLRINHSLTVRNRLSGGFQYQSRNTDNAQLYGWTDNSTGRGFAVDLGWAFTIGPRKVNDLRIRLNRQRTETLPYFAYRENVAGELGILGPSQNPLSWGPPTLNFTNFGDLTDSTPVIRRNQTVALTDTVSIVRGTHTMQAGAQLQWAQINTNSDQNSRGSFSFNGLLTSQLDANGQPVANTGFDLADYLLGLPQSSSIRYSEQTTYFRSRIYSGWAQDEWRARPNLTINAGLRYEYYSPYYEKYGHLANLDIASGFTGVSVVTPGQTGFPSGLIDPDRNNFAPRLGFAWRPIAKSRLQLRGGYSIFYDGTAYSTIAVRLAGQPPFASTSSINTSLGRVLTIENGFGNTVTAGKTITNNFAVGRSYVLPYAQTWNFVVQHELRQQLVVEAGYLGTKGTRLDVLRTPNTADPGSPLTAEQRRIIPNAANFTYDSSEANSIYHALQIRVARRLRRGVSFNALYTLSKSIDNASSVGGAGNTVAQNPRDLAAERGLSNFDQRHSLTITNLLNSPFGEGGFWLRDRSRVARLLKDWTLSTSATAHSGTPLTARVLGNVADTGGTGNVGNGRANATGLPVETGPGFLNLLAFTVPAPGQFGTAGRNTIPGPGFASLSFSVGRSFTLSERRRLEFRVNSENVTNHVNFTSFGTVVNAINYGVPTAVGSMRTINATVRFRF